MPQITYHINYLDFDASLQNILKSGLFGSLPCPEHHGKPQLFWFKKFRKTRFQIYHTGTMIVTWETLEQKTILFEWFNSFLVPLPGHTIDVHSISQNKKILHGVKEIPTYWCDEKITYVLESVEKVGEKPSMIRQWEKDIKKWEKRERRREGMASLKRDPVFKISLFSAIVAWSVFALKVTGVW